MVELEKLTQERFARALEKGRDRFNALYASARRGGRDLDAELFASALVRFAAPLVEAVGSIDESKVEETTAVAYEAALELVAMNLLGDKNRVPAMNRAFGETLVSVAKTVAFAPKKIVPAVLNGVFNLSQESPKVADAWMNEIAKIAPLCSDAKEFLDVGKVLAWRLGMAHYRESAVVTWKNLPDKLKLATLGINTSGAAIPSIEDAWTNPASANSGKRIEVVHRIGGFVGFGGKFLNPPTLVNDGDKVYALDTRRTYALHADVFGATITNHNGSDPNIKTNVLNELRLDKSGRATAPGLNETFPDLANWSCCEASGGALFLSHPDSHFIHVVAAVTR